MSVSEYPLPCPAFPSVSWWISLIEHRLNTVVFTGDNQKSWAAPNRYTIASANGPLLLSLPIKGGRKTKLNLQEACIDYTHDWQRQHWRALISAYGRAPFFDHFAPSLEAIIYGNHERLLEFNHASILWLAKAFRFQAPQFSHRLELKESLGFFREKDTAKFQEYYQVFSERIGFLPNLSAIDLLMNEGPRAGLLLTPH
ncbi:MAG: WbqC family protein [Bacteroidetes bacterium]|nr:WbqC family protein [Bacteroidota bacterium]